MYVKFGFFLLGMKSHRIVWGLHIRKIVNQTKNFKNQKNGPKTKKITLKMVSYILDLGILVFLLTKI